MITSMGPLKPKQMSREFQGSLPSVGAVAFVARIIREGLEIVQYPDYQGHNALPDEYLVQELAFEQQSAFEGQVSPLDRRQLDAARRIGRACGDLFGVVHGFR